MTYLKSIMSVPTKLETPMLANAMERRRITVAVVILKSTRVSINLQNTAVVGTSPIKPYTIPPNTRGGITRKGRMSKRICSDFNSIIFDFENQTIPTFDEKYVNVE